MTRPRKPWLDWRRERLQLDKLLVRQGGIVRIRSPHQGPLEEFANVLRSHLEHGDWPRQWRTIQFDPENSNTRYFGEMTRQIERTLGLPPQVAASVSLGSDTKIGSELNASSISINNSFNFGQTDYEQSVLEEQRIDRIVSSITERSNSEAVCFLFLNSHLFQKQDLKRFTSMLWNQKLEPLAATGVLLVDLTQNPESASGDWLPTPEVNLNLSSEYDEDARANAIDDLASFLLVNRLEASEIEAKTYSRSMLDSHCGPAALYGQLAAYLAKRLSS